MENYVINWAARINSNVGPSCRGRNKLRLYKSFKHNYSVENYCKMILPPRHRAAFRKFRCGVRRSAEDRTFKTVPGIRRVYIFPGDQPIRFIVT